MDWFCFKKELIKMPQHRTFAIFVRDLFGVLYRIILSVYMYTYIYYTHIID